LRKSGGNIFSFVEVAKSNKFQIQTNTILHYINKEDKDKGRFGGSFGEIHTFGDQFFTERVSDLNLLTLGMFGSTEDLLEIITLHYFTILNY
jgi:hypothetical protein